MPVNESEAFLHALGERTFLKLWALPNAYRAPGKELCDLVVAFGDDIILFSDKACAFSMAPDLATGWDRWRREAIDSSVKQLAGALRRLSGADQGIYLDAGAKALLSFPLPLVDRRRVHLVAIARPSHDPSSLPAGWKPLKSVAVATAPFEIERVEAGGRPVHVFDGEAIDLLLAELNTAPDFIAYLSGRAAALSTPDLYGFVEKDLLAASIANWSAGEGLSPHVPPLASVPSGAWRTHEESGRVERSETLNLRSATIDNLIEHFHRTFEAGAFLNDRPPEILEHEQALRLLAAESRFGRRMIATALTEILDEENQSVPWSATIPSPSRPGLRYVWLIYPDPPPEADPELFVRAVDQQLQIRALVAAGQHRADVVVAIALPNGKGHENVYVMRVLDSSDWTEEDRRRAELLNDGLFGEAQRVDHVHVP